jgi:hypothetical protein
VRVRRVCVRDWLKAESLLGAFGGALGALRPPSLLPLSGLLNPITNQLPITETEITNRSEMSPGGANADAPPPPSPVAQRPYSSWLVGLRECR